MDIIAITILSKNKSRYPLKNSGKAAIGGGIAATIIGIILASPLFYDVQVDEPLPVALDKLQEGLTYQGFVDMDDAQRAMIVGKMSEDTKQMVMDEAKKSDDTVSEDMSMEETPVVSKTGQFSGLAGHQASGVAKLIVVGDKSILRFEDFEVTNGPDLRVYITIYGNVNEGIHLEKLKGNRGNQNYELPAIDTETYNTVVIYCQPFGVYFADARLS